MSDWDLCLDQVLFGYSRRSSTDGKSPFEVLYGVKSRFSEENEASILPSTNEAREFELAIALAARAERVVPRMVTEEQKFKTGDWVLLRRGNQPKGSKFEARMWLEPYQVNTVQYPRYELENAPGRRSRKPVHVRRIRLYIQREGDNPKITNPFRAT